MEFNYYKITNIKNNKNYIGITEKETSERIKAKGIKFIRISEEEYYNIKPITLIK